MHIVRRSSWVNISAYTGNTVHKYISAYTAGTVPKYISIFLMLLTDKWPAAWPKGGYQRHILHRADEEAPSDISLGYMYSYRLERRYITKSFLNTNMCQVLTKADC